MGVKAREKVPGSGDWYIFINHRGVRRAERIPPGKGAKKRAETRAEQIRAQLTLGDRSILVRPAVASSMPEAPAFDEFARAWLDHYPTMHVVKPCTVENYRSFTERHLVPYFGATPVSEVTVERIEAFIEAKRSPGGSAKFASKALSDASLRTGLMALRLILKRAVRRRLLTGNPMAELDWRGAARIEHVDPFTGAELRAILAASAKLDPDLGTMIRLWAQTGMRAGEVCGLRREDFDFARGMVMVQRTWTRRRNGSPKTGRARLVSLLHPVADNTPDWRPGATEAARSLVAGLQRVKVAGLDPGAPMFVTERGQPWDGSSLNRRWRRVLTSARVRYRAPEQLRHTFASTMLSRNAPLLYVQQQGGWTSAAVLLRVYARWMPQADVTPGAVVPATPATQAQPLAVARA